MISITLFLLLCFVSVSVLAADPSKWQRLEDDGLHDPSNDALDELQQPGDALSGLPYDYAGNRVNWIKALQDGLIAPRTNLFPDTSIRVIDLDIIMNNTGEMHLVRFPHRQHTEWLDCNNCHNKIFIDKVDATPVNMFSILQGEYCGRCHGAVSFPLTECNRCHSVPRNSFKGQFGAQYKEGESREDFKVEAPLE
ncbi:c(7)-type cytochrome triheme domain-containing protein [Aestuariirhabdus litorea]|uniref:c(7)-type cytochrome triheme domain-containing protein n=1 Tax=Aestuariirhabdus litorea TaxID=2528527 RepID=UPI001A9E033F|nr:c(7)-type cytochrome triheme domain-containing protein [Aestuariirhabdus litorea]